MPDLFPTSIDPGVGVEPKKDFSLPPVQKPNALDQVQKIGGEQQQKRVLPRNESGGFNMRSLAPVLSTLIGGGIGAMSGKGFITGAAHGAQFGAGIQRGLERREDKRNALAIEEGKLDLKRQQNKIASRRVAAEEKDIHERSKLSAENRFESMMDKMIGHIENGNDVGAESIRDQLFSSLPGWRDKGYVDVPDDFLASYDDEGIRSEIRSRRKDRSYTSLRDSINGDFGTYEEAHVQSSLAGKILDGDFGDRVTEEERAKFTAIKEAADSMMEKGDDLREDERFSDAAANVLGMGGADARAYFNTVKKNNRLGKENLAELQSLVNVQERKELIGIAQSHLSSMSGSKDMVELEDGYTAMLEAMGVKNLDTVGLTPHDLAKAVSSGNIEKQVEIYTKILLPLSEIGKEEAARNLARKIVGTGERTDSKGYAEKVYPLSKAGSYTDVEWSGVSSLLKADDFFDPDNKATSLAILRHAEKMVIFDRALNENSQAPKELSSQIRSGLAKIGETSQIKTGSDPMALRPALSASVPAREQLPLDTGMEQRRGITGSLFPVPSKFQPTPGSEPQQEPQQVAMQQPPVDDQPVARPALPTEVAEDDAPEGAGLSRFLPEGGPNEDAEVASVDEPEAEETSQPIPRGTSAKDIIEAFKFGSISPKQLMQWIKDNGGTKNKKGKKGPTGSIASEAVLKVLDAFRSGEITLRGKDIGDILGENS